MRRLLNYLDDILVGAGCGCILYGASLWSPVAAWIAAGIMLIVAGLIVGKVKS